MNKLLFMTNNTEDVRKILDGNDFYDDFVDVKEIKDKYLS